MASSWEERIDEADAEHDYTLFSDGMSSEAVVIINGQEFRGLNAQGDAHIKSAKLETANVKVKVVAAMWPKLPWTTPTTK